MQVTLVIDTSIVDSLRYRRYIDNRPLASRSYLRCSHAVYFKSPDLRLYGGATLKLGWSCRESNPADSS